MISQRCCKHIKKISLTQDAKLLSIMGIYCLFSSVRLQQKLERSSISLALLHTGDVKVNPGQVTGKYPCMCGMWKGGEKPVRH